MSKLNPTRAFLTQLDLSHLFLPFSLLFIVMVFLFKNHPYLQMQITIVAAMYYLVFAVIHHYIDKTLSLKIILEYVVLALFAITLVSGLLF